jgi:hypothetical protein
MVILGKNICRNHTFSIGSWFGTFPLSLRCRAATGDAQGSEHAFSVYQLRRAIRDQQIFGLSDQRIFQMPERGR